jgi:hypothetical protein
MNCLHVFILPVCMIIFPHDALTRDQQARIDSLVNHLKTAGREWNDYATSLIEIGEPAVPALIEMAQDKSLDQWTRRITIMTLNDIRSGQWFRPALEILFDRREDPVTRNQVTTGLKGFDLSDVKDELWKLYEEATDEFYKLNLAGLLMTADT